ncbi:MAG: chemotaxis protein CheX [Desulfosoma sp.]
MHGKWQEVMKAAISEVLETMYFTDVVFQPDTAQEIFTGWEATIDVRPAEPGPSRRVRLCFLDDFARELAANMLGEDSTGLNEDEVRDALQELANMVAGSCVLLLGPENWRLGLPTAHRAVCHPSQQDCGLAMVSSGVFVGRASCVQQ